MSDWVAPLSAEPLFLQLKRSIIQYLRDNGYGPGDRIPSENDFCACSAVSIRTVRRALAELSSEGILQRIRGRGTFLCRPLPLPEDSAGVIGISFSDNSYMTRPVFLQLLSAMAEEIVRQGYHYHLYATGQRASAAAAPLSQLLPQDLPAVLLATSALNRADISFLREHGVALCAFNQYRQQKVSAVRFDFAAAAGLALDYLQSRHCQRILFLGEHFFDSDDAVIYGHEEFRDTVLAEAGKRKLPAAGLTFRSVPQDEDGGAEAIAALKNTLRLPDAVCALSPLVAKGALAAARACSLPVREWLCCYDSGDPAIASLRVPLAEMGRTAVQFGLQALNGEPGRIYAKAFGPQLTAAPEGSSTDNG